MAAPTTGGVVEALLSRFLYLLIFRVGSRKYIRSSNILRYLLGSLSHVLCRRDTVPVFSPDRIANMELKFLKSLQYSVRERREHG